MANNTFDSIEITESAKLGTTNKLYLTKSSVTLNTTNPYAKITWANGNGVASYNKGSISIEYREGILISAKTNSSVCIVRDTNNSLYFKVINGDLPITLELDYVILSKDALEIDSDTGPTLVALPNLEVGEHDIDVCKMDTTYNKNKVEFSDISAKINSAEARIHDLFTTNARVINNLKLEGVQGEQAYITSELYKLDKVISISNASNAEIEIKFSNFDSGVLMGNILDDESKSLANFIIIKNTTKANNGTENNSNILFSYSQVTAGSLIKLNESLNGISLISNLKGKLSYGYIYNNNPNPTVEIHNEINPSPSLSYQIPNKLNNTVVIGREGTNGLEVIGELRVSKFIGSNTEALNLKVLGKSKFLSNVVVGPEKDPSAPEVANAESSNTPAVELEVNGNLKINGDIYQNGSTYETHTEEVFIKNNNIVLRDEATTGLGDNEFTGIVAHKYDGTNDGRLVFDNKGIAKVGDAGSEQTLATREDNPVNNSIMIWDDNKKLFKTPTELDNVHIGSSEVIATKNFVTNEINKLSESIKSEIVKTDTKIKSISDGITIV